MFFHLKLNGQHHAKMDLRTYAKSVDPDKPPMSPMQCLWSGSALFDNSHINCTYISCCVNNLITYRCFQHCIGADMVLNYNAMSKGPFKREAGKIFPLHRSKLHKILYQRAGNIQIRHSIQNQSIFRPSVGNNVTKCQYDLGG